MFPMTAHSLNHCLKIGVHYTGKDGVCDLGRYSDNQLSKLFATISVGDIWGIGRKISEKLISMKIETVEDLRKVNPHSIRRQFSIVVERTVNELNGISSIELDDANRPRQQIMVSRSFGQEVSSYDDLAESVAYFATSAAEKLRKDGSVAVSLCVFIHTNPFKEKSPQYQRSIVVPVGEPTADTTRLVNVALQGLCTIFRVGFGYKKSGVLLMGLQSKHAVQGSLFDDEAGQEKSERLMGVMDSINRRMGKGSMAIAASGTHRSWAMRRDRKSPNYTTDWNELPTAS